MEQQREMMNRQDAYQELVNRRKAHVFPHGLVNPQEIQGGQYDSNHLGPWSRWQGDLQAEIVVVGQDWGNLQYFLDNQGMDNDQEPTCQNLSYLAGAAGWKTGTPHHPIHQRLFFTNAVLGIRATGGKSEAVPAAWVEDSLPFLVELLGIIQPRILISLGTTAYRACRLALFGKGRDQGLPLGARLSQLNSINPISRPGKPAWFALYHCSPLGVANRSLLLQGQDWADLWLVRPRDLGANGVSRAS